MGNIFMWQTNGKLQSAQSDNNNNIIIIIYLLVIIISLQHALQAIMFYPCSLFQMQT